MPDFRTDWGNARRFVDQHGADVRYIDEWGKWLVWNDTIGRWEVDNDGAVIRLAEETILQIFHEALMLNNQADRDALLKHSMRSQSEPRLKAMVNLARAEVGHHDLGGGA